MNSINIKRALISVHDKTGIIEFARRLQQFGIEIFSTGGTFQTLKSAGIPVRTVTDLTEFPEILSGRVKTLHPKVFAGLLAINDNLEHQKQIQDLNISSIDLVVINLYPFEKVVSSPNATFEEVIENIDIGGPALIRAAAKNFKYKTVIVEPEEYQPFISELEKQDGAVSEQTRLRLAQLAFKRITNYDLAIENYFSKINGGESPNLFSDYYSITLKKDFELRYGENPHQKAVCYGTFSDYFTKLHGKELSYNNILDIESAVQLVEEFDKPTVAIIKHTNPCGVASGETLAEAYQNALATDPISAFGGIVCTNQQLDFTTASLIDKIFTEVIIAPDFSDDALGLLKKKKDRRLVKQTKFIRTEKQFQLRSIPGGLLVQTEDDTILLNNSYRVVTKRQPTEEELIAMEFAWKVVKHVKSNAIVYSIQNRTLGIGAGQMSRIDSARFAALKAKESGNDLRGSVVASDAFFPFADGLLEAVKAGASAVIQPGGSVRDKEVIDAADEHNIAMVFTGIRHFKH